MILESHPMKKSLIKVLSGMPFKIAAGLVVTYLLLAYFAVDPLAKRILPWVAEHKLASRASVEHVRFDPLRLTLTLDKLRLTRPDGAPLAGFDRLYVNLEASGLFRFAWRIKDILLTAPQVTLDVSPEGKLNWADLIAKLNENPDEKSDEIPRVIIDHILIQRGIITYSQRNRPTPFHAELEPLGLELEGLSTLPEDRGDYQIAARLPEQGGTLKWKGNIGLNPVVSNGSFALEGIKLAKLMQVAPPGSIPVQLTAGELQTGLDYRFAMIKDGENLAPEVQIKDIALKLSQVQGTLVQAPGSAVELQELGIHLPELHVSMAHGTQLQLNGMSIGLKNAALHQDKTPLFKLADAQINALDFDLNAHQLKVGAVALNGGTVQATQQANGVLNWQALSGAPSNQHPTASSKPTTDETPMNIEVASIRLNHWQAGFQDLAMKHALDLHVSDFNLGFALSMANNDLAVQDIQSQTGRITLTSALYPQAAATLEKTVLQDGAVSLKQKSIKLKAITFSGLQTQVLREANQPLNWLAMLEPATAAAAPAKPTHATASSTPDWKLALERIALENGTVHLQDSSAPSPVALDLQNASFEIRNPTLDLSKAVPVSARFKVKQGGQFDASGKLAMAPLKGDFKLKLAALSFKPFAPYINQFALLKLNDGSATVDGALAVKSDKALNAQFQGAFSIDNLAISEENTDATFLGWKKLGSDSLKIGLGPNLLHMDELRIVQPIGKVIIYEDKSINIKRILRPQPPSAAGDAAKPADGTSDFPVSVERIKVEDGDMEFADLSLKPQFGTHMNSLSGVINGLSTSPDTTAQVELDGKVDEYGSARIRGALQPFRATEFTDLTLAFHNLEMNHLTPYSGKFAGRRIDSGKMSVDLEYKIKHRQMSGENKFVINKLKLGEHVDSPDAVNLPLDLAIAILEDSDGNIDLDLPVSGSLDDPQFSYGKIVWKAIVNVLGKIVTAPFRALGNLLGISADKMEAVAFDPGSADLAPPEQEKLKKLAEAMTKRPSLTLTIIPSYDPVADKKALQETAVRQDIAQKMGLKLKTGEKPGPIDINNPKAQAALRTLVKERSPEAKNRKLLDKFKDYIDLSKPTDPAAYEAMLTQLQQWVAVSDTELKALADARATVMLQALDAMAGRITKGAAEPVNSEGSAVKLKMNLGTAKSS